MPTSNETSTSRSNTGDTRFTRPMPSALPQLRSPDDPAPVPSAEPAQANAPADRKALAARRRRLVIAALSLFILAVGPVAIFGRGRGLKTRLIRLAYPHYNYAHVPLRIAGTKPGDGQTGVPTDTSIVLGMKLPGTQLDPRTINTERVSLVRTCDQQVVPATVTIGGKDGDRIIIQPSRPLEPRTDYTVFLISGIFDNMRNPLLPRMTSFVTAGALDPALNFQKVSLTAATGAGFTCVAMGPDRTLWASSDDGRIFRFAISSDGQLATPQIFSSLTRSNNGNRLVTGFCFDPSSTVDRPVLWVSHAFFGFRNCPDFTSKMTRMSGRDLETVQDIVINLPRSTRDHMINQPVFGPDGALYWPQPSNSAFGAPDPEWGNRPEHLLNASILRLDVSKLAPGKPLDAKTKDAGGDYDPFAPDAPLTIYAYGVRLAYDLCWHSNGHLYAAVNGSSAGGNTPAGKGVAAVNRAAFAEDDWLFKITPGKYYGHPNPAAGYFVFNGGNPTSAHDSAELFQYPVGTQPDPNWDRPIWDFGKHISADGTIEYRNAKACAGHLRGKLLVCRYNIGSDIIAISLDEKGNAKSAEFGIPGLSDLDTPLDLIEDPDTGNLYIAEYGAQRITLARPLDHPASSTASLNPAE